MTDRIDDPQVREFVLAFADDEHLVGSRHAEWIGTAPFLEEDLVFCSIAQDELGHAIGLYELLTDDVDRFALLRAPEDYRSCHLAERAAPTWDEALVRHWLYDRAERFRWEALAGSSLPALAGLAGRALREESFHTEHADRFLERVVSADTVTIIVAAIERLLPDALGLWEPVAGEAKALAEGVTTAASDELGAAWRRSIEQQLDALDVTVTWPAEPTRQSGRTIRSAGFGSFLESLQTVIGTQPEASW